MTVWKELLQLEPENLESTLGLADAEFQNERWASAISGYSAALKLLERQPNGLVHAYALTQMGKAMQAQEKYQESLECFDKVAGLIQDGALSRSQSPSGVSAFSSRLLHSSQPPSLNLLTQCSTGRSRK